MKIYFNLILVIFLIMIGTVARSQNRTTIRGTITGTNNEPLPGVNIVVVDENNRYLEGTITDRNGRYTLIVNDRSNKIQFSFIGYESKRLDIDSEIINVKLEESVEELEGVEVVAEKKDQINLFTIPQADRTTSNQVVEMEALREVSVVTVEEALQGRLANVDMISNTGDPGGQMSIRIRGTASLNANMEPLIVLDGMPYNTSFGDDFDFKTATSEDYGALVSISPENIESIEVLKDAGATAIYGSRGANGVLLINTKRGTAGKTRFTYSLRSSYKIEPKTIPLLSGDDYIGLVSEALWNSYLYTERKDESYLNLKADFPELTGDEQFKYFDEYYSNTNWLGEITRDPFSFDHNFNMSGGGEKARYRVYLGYLDENGNTINSDFQRVSTGMNLDYFLSDKITFTTDFSYTNSTRNSPASYGGQVRNYAKQKMPNMSPYILDDELNPTGEYFQPLRNWQGTGVQMPNPVAMAEESLNQVKVERIRSIFRINYRIVTGLNYQLNVAFDKNTFRLNGFVPQTALGTNWENTATNQSSVAMSESFNVETDNKVIYSREFNENHDLTALVNIQTSQFMNEGYNSSVSNIPSASIIDVTGNGVVRGISNASSESRMVGIMSQVHYKLFDKYMLSGGMRADGSSRFGKNKRWGYFPNAGLAWNINKENFLSDVNWMDQFKLLVNYGQSGNAPSASYAYYGTIGSFGSYMEHQALFPQKMTLNNLKWEITNQLNVGFDLFLFDDKLNLTSNYYIKKTNDLLMGNVILPSFTGFDRIAWLNSGNMQNEGVEFYGYWNPLKSKLWDLRLDFNFGRNINKITKLPDNVTTSTYNYANGVYAEKVVIGDAVGSIYGFKCDGVYSTTEETKALDENGNVIITPMGKELIMTDKFYNEFKAGDAKYRDINKDGVIDEYDIVYLGNVNPVVTGGFGPSMRYKDFSIRMYFHYRLGQKIINRARIDTENMRGTSNQSVAVLKRWRKEGDVTDIPHALYGLGYNTLGSDRFVENGDFMRLKTLTLSYNIPNDFVKKFNLSQFRVFVTGYDLYTWTKYSGQDPEVGIDGIDNSYTPQARKFTFGLNVEF